MRDVAIALILLASVGLALYRPWLGVLALAVFAYLHPQGYAEGAMRQAPVFAILFGAVALSTLWAAVRRPQEVSLPVWARAGAGLAPRPGPWWDWRIGVLAALWLWLAVTSHFAIIPWLAWPRFREVSSVFVALLPTLLLIDNRDKLRALLAVIALAIGLVAVKGGYWAFMTGFGDRVYGPPGSHFSDNNHFAVLAVMNLPLLALWRQEATDPRLRHVLAAAIGLSVAAALSSWSRGALLALSVTGALMLLQSRRRSVALAAAVAVIALAFALLPESWFERMQTIAGFRQEGSAVGRLDVWRVGIGYALTRPVVGIGFENWMFASHFGGGGKDWHSAYVEVLAEHGFVGLGLWLGLLVGSIVSLSRLASRSARGAVAAWVGPYALAIRTSLVAYAVGAAFLGVSYWDIAFHMVILGIVLLRLAANAGSQPTA